MIRDTVFNKTGIDIDTGIKPEIVAMIKEFYVNKLKLTPNEVEYHLPQKKTSSEPRTGIDQVIRAQPASLVLTNHGIALGAHPVANIAS